MATVTIDSQPFVTYEDEAGADLYLSASIHNASWLTATALTKQLALVTATRILDRQKWLGEVSVAGQDLAWPRNSTGVDGVTDIDIPQKLIDASTEMALSLVDGSDVQDDQNVAQKLSKLKAGSVALEYFRGAEGAPLRFPLIIHELVREFLAGQALAVTGIVSGAGGTSVTATDFGLSKPL